MFVRHKYSSSITGFIKRRVRESSPLEWTSLVTCSRVGGPLRSTETWEQKQLQSHSTGSFNNLMSKVRNLFYFTKWISFECIFYVLRCIRCWKRHGFHKVQDIVLFAGTACQGLPVPAHCRPKVRDRLPGKEEKDAYFACRIDIVHSASDPANCRQAILRRLFLFSSSGDGNMFGGSRLGPSWESWPSTTLLTQLRVKLSNRLTK